MLELRRKPRQFFELEDDAEDPVRRTGLRVGPRAALRGLELRDVDTDVSPIHRRFDERAPRRENPTRRVDPCGCSRRIVGHPRHWGLPRLAEDGVPGERTIGSPLIECCVRVMGDQGLL